MASLTAQTGIVYLVGAGPGDPDLITVRGIECLKHAEVVVYDRLANPSLLAHAKGAELIDVGKQPNRHPVPQSKINAILVEKARAGKGVVRLKGGDPCVFGRGGEEAQALVEAGLPFEIVPGVTSAIAAPIYAGIPVTHRNVACSLAIITGHRADSVHEAVYDWASLARGADTIVFLMGVANLPLIVEQLTANGRSPETPVALVEQGTRTIQKTVVGTLATIVAQAADICPPAAIIVGEVVHLRESLRWFDRPDRRPLLGLRVLNTRPLEQAADFSRRLARLGAEAIELPTTRVVPVVDPGGLLDQTLARLVTPPVSYDWIIFTTTNSVFFIFDRLLALGYDVRALAGIKLGVIGRATAQALRRYGLLADVGPPHPGQTIAMEVNGTAGRRVLLPYSNAEFPHLVETLQARGTTVEMILTYTVQAADPDPVGLAALLGGEVDVATFISPAGLTGLATMLNGQKLPDVLAPLTVACIGPATADTARVLGVRVDLVAKKHTVEGLIEALLEWRVRKQ